MTAANAPTDERPKPAVPRPSSSLVIINDKNEILLVHRNPDSRSFAGVHVFPGGNLDIRQDASLQMTAIRETFEESGVLLATSKTRSAVHVPESTLDEARRAIHSQKLAFVKFLEEHDLEADTAALLPFTQWITPVSVPRRFHTQFYVTFLPSASTHSGRAGRSGDHRHQLPTPDGGQEVIAARFVHPQDALAEFQAGSISFMPPQFYIISTLAAYLPTRVHTKEQRETVERLSSGPFGAMVLNPRPLPNSEATGKSVLTYEGDETRGGKKGRLHRSLVSFGKRGAPSAIELQRNFDIFTEIETHLFNHPSKL